MKITFHSWLKTTIGDNSVEVNLPQDIKTISGLASFLATKYEDAAAVFELPEALRYVVDRRYVTPKHELTGVDAIEIYPPITGG